MVSPNGRAGQRAAKVPRLKIVERTNELANANYFANMPGKLAPSLTSWAVMTPFLLGRGGRVIIRAIGVPSNTIDMCFSDCLGSTKHACSTKSDHTNVQFCNAEIVGTSSPRELHTLE